MSDLILTCVVCGKPIPLEKANTNADGRAVHSECLLGKAAHGQTADSQTDPPKNVNC